MLQLLKIKMVVLVRLRAQRAFDVAVSEVCGIAQQCVAASGRAVAPNNPAQAHGPRHSCIDVFVSDTAPMLYTWTQILGLCLSP